MKLGTIYKGKSEDKKVIFSRVWSMPTPWTFLMTPVKELLLRYMKNPERWIDPYAGKNSPAGMTNDHNPEMKADYCMEAIEFAEMVHDEYDGILFDPPYSFRQISEHYKIIGKKATQKDTSMAFYEKTKSAFCEKVRGGGVCDFFWMELKRVRKASWI